MEHISVCICTYNRRDLLVRLLQSLDKQVTENLFAYSVIVVDNDACETARGAVESTRKTVTYGLDYRTEPRKNIALARNKALLHSSGGYVAMLDDDELPGDRWLFNLYQTKSRYGVNGVFGPVLPLFENTPPNWLVRSRLCERATFETGTMLRESRYLRTGNVLFDRHIFGNLPLPFNPKFGRSGGEDADFFERMLQRGHSFVWCNEAAVYENVPAERQTTAYFMKRAFLRGVTEADLAPFFCFGTIKSLLAVVTYLIMLPFLAVMGYHLFVRYLIKLCDHLSKLLAYCGVRLARQRTF